MRCLSKHAVAPKSKSPAPIQRRSPRTGHMCSHGLAPFRLGAFLSARFENFSELSTRPAFCASLKTLPKDRNTSPVAALPGLPQKGEKKRPHPGNLKVQENDPHAALSRAPSSFFRGSYEEIAIRKRVGLKWVEQRYPQLGVTFSCPRHFRDCPGRVPTCGGP